MNDELRDLGLAYLWTFIGTFYSWGGDDPSGFDCSGLAIEYLSSIGAVPKGFDTTADGLKARFPAIDRPRLGCLVLRLTGEGKAVHVEVCYKLVPDSTGHVKVYTIGASGGGSATKTKEDAMQANAFVKLRPWTTPPARTVYAWPF